MTLTTRGVSPMAPPCSADERRCAVLHLAIKTSAITGAIMPIEIASNAVRLDHLVFQGTRLSDPALSAKRCASDKERAMAGGLLVNGNTVTITRSVFRDMACYTALEYGTGVEGVIKDNAFTGNGTHDALLRWADGLTIHTAQRFQVSGNRFRDNTDVQLIFGSCVGCTITGNHFDHSGSAEGGAFAEIMLQAWPKATSGDFTGTQVTRNTINCGAQRRCGFGIMIGSAPWYEASTFGGEVTDNRVRGAMLALNVDYLTGPMVIARNDLETVSGTYPSMCGPQRISGASANFSPRSRTVLPPIATDTTTTAKHYCILNYAIR
ncbi:right-handed parallel beta-helix repeat-containing protein [Sphingomonas sp. Leaf198]|uniref:right-handed parallel beta-helix repeat-containing protein n=1 Tax=Sphingomonas sp. Leaf198 TaxID=1736299 RepID=UPI0014439EDF|nr:right-handed parallel beta-helix repeat-containing protein [Sphingomonas sp. Leaf198]